jgi:hypothetical protein
VDDAFATVAVFSTRVVVDEDPEPDFFVPAGGGAFILRGKAAQKRAGAVQFCGYSWMILLTLCALQCNICPKGEENGK